MSLIVGLVGVSTEFGAGVEASFIAAVLVVGALISVLYLIALSAIGGYLGVYLYDERGSVDDEQASAT